MSILDDLSDLPPQILAELRIMPSQNFTCVSCGKLVDCRWNPRGSSREIPPLCCVCERVSGYDWSGRPRYRTKPTGGSFMDRRNATRILALADELAAAANRIKWSRTHAT